jgi:hypothetical protein
MSGLWMSAPGGQEQTFRWMDIRYSIESGQSPINSPERRRHFQMERAVQSHMPEPSYQ